MQAIYYQGFQEIARQVSVQCKQRGELLQHVWRGYFAEIRRSINGIRDQKDKEITKLSEEMYKH